MTTDAMRSLCNLLDTTYGKDAIHLFNIYTCADVDHLIKTAYNTIEITDEIRNIVAYTLENVDFLGYYYKNREKVKEMFSNLEDDQ